MADISGALERARRMIKNDAKADAHIIKERVADRNNSVYFADQPNDMYSNLSLASSTSSNGNMMNESYDDDFSNDKFNSALESLGSRDRTQTTVSEGEYGSAASKLPKEILESLSTNPIEGKEVFDPDYELIKAKKLIQESDKKRATTRPVITESAPHAIGVDYSLIKTIVEDCMRKYAGSIVKKVLTESKGSTEDSLKAIKIGDKFSFITSNGDLYEAELKFKKNVNKK